MPTAFSDFPSSSLENSQLHALSQWFPALPAAMDSPEPTPQTPLFTSSAVRLSIYLKPPVPLMGSQGWDTSGGDREKREERAAADFIADVQTLPELITPSCR